MTSLIPLLVTLAQAPPLATADVTPRAVVAHVESPDAVSLLKGRQAVQVTWHTTESSCTSPRFRVEVSAGEGGGAIAQGELRPSHAQVDWGGYTLTLPYVPVTVLPLYAEVEGCCGLSCASSPPVPVKTFLSSAIWSGGALAAPGEASVDALLGTDGRGGVWLYRRSDGALRGLPLLGAPIELMPLGGDPKRILGVEGRTFLVDSRGIHLLTGRAAGQWSTLFEATTEPIALAVDQSSLESSPQRASPGPCAVGEGGTVWCRLARGEEAREVARIPGIPLSGARLVGPDLWFLAQDGRLLTMRLGATPGAVRSVLSRDALLTHLGGRIPAVLGADPGTQELWLGDHYGHLWRASVDEDGELSVEEPIQLPEAHWEIRALEADGRGRLAALTAGGLCTLAGQAVGCRGEPHGWTTDLSSLSWALPGVLWVGDRFLLTAPSTPSSMRLAYLSALLVGALLTAILAALAIYRFRDRALGSLRRAGEVLARAVAREVGWGVAVSAVLLPQGLVLAVDRLLGDLDLGAAPSMRVVPAALFVLSYLVGVHGVRSWAEMARLAGRQQLPSFILLGMVWALCLTLWVWPAAPRGPEVDPMLALIHLGLAVLTGLATLFYLVTTLSRTAAEARAG